MLFMGFAWSSKKEKQHNPGQREFPSKLLKLKSIYIYLKYQNN